MPHKSRAQIECQIMQYLKIDKGGKVFGIVALIQTVWFYLIVLSPLVYRLHCEHNEPLDGLSNTKCDAFIGNNNKTSITTTNIQLYDEHGDDAYTEKLFPNLICNSNELFLDRFRIHKIILSKWWINWLWLLIKWC